VVNAIGARQARRYFTTAETIPASRALAIGLVHEVAPDAALAEVLEGVLAALLQGAPEAQAEAKALVFLAEGRPVDAALRAETGRRIAARRASPEGREGLGAFLDKRTPAWRKD
jgi:methylglutaconyl-CoA hydratase